MKFRKLRIAWSVFWGVACVPLIVLWARSYTVVDFFEACRFGRRFYCMSSTGFIAIRFERTWADLIYWSWSGGTGPANESYSHLLPIFTKNSTAVFSLYIPFWIVEAVIVLLAAASWLPWDSLIPRWHVRRFTLRTLLIATTLVAVVLGLVVWAAG